MPEVNPQTSASPTKPYKPVTPMYAVAIQHAIAGGELAAMKSTAAEAEKHLSSYGDVGAALEALKIQIAILEAKR